MLRSVFTKALWDQRRAYLGWMAGVAGTAILYAVFYPWMDTPAMAEAMAAYPEGLLEAFGWQDVVSPEGYLAGTVFNLLGPVLLVIYAIAFGSAAIAGDEEAGTLELLIAHPVNRTSVLLQRAAALTVGLIGLGAVVWVSLIAIAGPSGIDIAPGRLAAASLQIVLLALCFGALALLMGAASGRRGVVIGVTASVAVASYLANNLATLVDQIAWVQRLSLFFYATGGEPLRNGVQFGDAGLILAVTLLLLAGAVVAFSRRDVAV
jgi:ABC-2 type transport system permease protein